MLIYLIPGLFHENNQILLPYILVGLQFFVNLEAMSLGLDVILQQVFQPLVFITAPAENVALYNSCMVYLYYSIPSPERSTNPQEELHGPT